jgi:hypothetical protein
MSATPLGSSLLSTPTSAKRHKKDGGGGGEGGVQKRRLLDGYMTDGGKYPVFAPAIQVGQYKFAYPDGDLASESINPIFHIKAAHNEIIRYVDTFFLLVYFNYVSTRGYAVGRVTFTHAAAATTYLPTYLPT